MLQGLGLCGIFDAVAGLNRFMYMTFSFLRLPPKAVSAALLWLISVSVSAAMAFVKGGSSTLSAFGLNTWWGPFIPALLVILFFRWLSSRPEN